GEPRDRVGHLRQAPVERAMERLVPGLGPAKEFLVLSLHADIELYREVRGRDRGGDAFDLAQQRLARERQQRAGIELDAEGRRAGAGQGRLIPRLWRDDPGIAQLPERGIGARRVLDITVGAEHEVSRGVSGPQAKDV